MFGAHLLVAGEDQGDRKSTRLNSSHMSISYAVFCLKKKNSNESKCNARHVSSRRCYLPLPALRGERVGVRGSLHTPFFFNDTATTEIYTLSLHDALPI